MIRRPPRSTLLSLHDALPIWASAIADPWFGVDLPGVTVSPELVRWGVGLFLQASPKAAIDMLRTFFTRSEEHTSELQSRQYLVCRLLLEKKKIQRILQWTKPQ